MIEIRAAYRHKDLDLWGCRLGQGVPIPKVLDITIIHGTPYLVSRLEFTDDGEVSIHLASATWKDLDRYYNDPRLLS